MLFHYIAHPWEKFQRRHITTALPLFMYSNPTNSEIHFLRAKLTTTIKHTAACTYLFVPREKTCYTQEKHRTGGDLRKQYKKREERYEGR